MGCWLVFHGDTVYRDLQGGQPVTVCAELSRGPGRVYPAIVPDKVFRDRGYPMLTGSGSMKDDACGSVRSWAVCSGDVRHAKKKIPRSCGRPVCPECWPTWATRQAQRIASRVDGYRYALTDEQQTLPGFTGKKVYSANHHALTPPQSAIDEVAYKTEKRIAKRGGDFWPAFLDIFREKVYSMLELSGLDGGAVVVHLYRITDEKFCKAQAEKEGYASKWQWVIAQPNWDRYVHFYPHAHVVSYGYAKETGKFYDESGSWVLKKIRSVKETEKLCYYLLTHVCHVPGKNSVTWWGCLSTKLLRCVETFSVKEYAECETCGALMVHAITELDESQPDGVRIVEVLHDRPLYRKVLKRRYVIVRAALDTFLQDLLEKHKDAVRRDLAGGGAVG